MNPSANSESATASSARALSKATTGTTFTFDEDGGKLRDALVNSRLIRDHGFSLQYGARIVDRRDAEPMVIYGTSAQGNAAYRLRNDPEWLDVTEAVELGDLLAANWAR